MAHAADSTPLDPDEEELTPELALVDPELALRARERLSEEPPPPSPGPPAHPAPAVAGGDVSDPVPRSRRRLRARMMLMAAVAVAAGAVGITVPAIFFSDSQPRSGSVALERPRAGVTGGTARPGATAPTESPAAGRPRTFGWVAVDRASHYHVAFFRGRDKIFETWPRRPRMNLPARWTFNGRRERLSPGTYRWVVRPGFGPRRDGRYGRPIVDAALVIRR